MMLMAWLSVCGCRSFVTEGEVRAGGREIPAREVRVYIPVAVVSKRMPCARGRQDLNSFVN